MFCVRNEPGICLELAAGSQQAMAGLGNLPEGEFSVASGERGGAVDDMLRGGGEALGAAPGRSWGEDRGDCGKSRDSTALPNTVHCSVLKVKCLHIFGHVILAEIFYNNSNSTTYYSN